MLGDGCNRNLNCSHDRWLRLARYRRQRHRLQRIADCKSEVYIRNRTHRSQQNVDRVV